MDALSVDKKVLLGLLKPDKFTSFDGRNTFVPFLIRTRHKIFSSTFEGLSKNFLQHMYCMCSQYKNHKVGSDGQKDDE